MGVDTETGETRRLLEHDNLPQPHPGTESLERAFEVVEPDPAIDQSLDRQPAGQVQGGVAREVGRRIRESVVGTQDPAAAINQRIDAE